METLASSYNVQNSGLVKAKTPSLSGFRAVVASSLVTAGITTGLLGLLADSASASRWGCRSACTPVVRVCRSACFPSYARPTYFPRSYHAYPTYYGVR